MLAFEKYIVDEEEMWIANEGFLIFDRICIGAEVSCPLPIITSRCDALEVRESAPHVGGSGFESWRRRCHSHLMVQTVSPFDLDSRLLKEKCLYVYAYYGHMKK